MKSGAEPDGVLFPQDSMGGSPNDIRISDMRPTLVEPPMYKPKVVLLGKDKKGMKLGSAVTGLESGLSRGTSDHVAAVSAN